MKKKLLKTLILDYCKYPALIVACLAALGIMYRYGYNVLTIPERVEAAEQKIESVEDYIKEQRIANDLMRDMFQQQQQQQQPSCEQDKDGVWWCWDYKEQRWIKQGGQ